MSIFSALFISISLARVCFVATSSFSVATSSLRRSVAESQSRLSATESCPFLETAGKHQDNFLALQTHD